MAKTGKKPLKLFVNYLWIAGLATLVDAGILVILRVKLHLYVWLSAGMAYACGMTTNFLLNKYLNFASDNRPFLKQARTFFVVAIIGLGLTAGLMEFLVQVTHLKLLVAKAISVAVVMFWSFWGHEQLTFQEGIRSYLSCRLTRRSGDPDR
ncbi:MAG: GtrA family protein [bacterium]|nr:GtrA family protein [bacterium]